MSSTILIVGATGNTGRAVVETLSHLLSDKPNRPRLLALGRSAESSEAKSLAALPGVDFEEKDWTTIKVDWLTQRNVVKAFVASHNLPHHFFDESTLLLALRDAGVVHVVRISTTQMNVRPDTHVAYGRAHWALETLLESPTFDSLKWTSLQPNVFTAQGLGPVVEWVKAYKKIGQQTPLKLQGDENQKIAYVHAHDVGVFAGHLLATDDFQTHASQKYVFSGPEGVSGRDLVKLAEEATGTSIKDVRYRNTDVFEDAVKAGNIEEKYYLGFRPAMAKSWVGRGATTEVSPAVQAIYPPTSTVKQVFEEMLKE